MKMKYAFKFGGIAGLIMIVSWFVTNQLFGSGDGEAMDFGSSELLGYASMLLAFSMVFLGVKSYRDKESSGAFTFGRAFLIGLYIVLVTSVIYVLGWMVYYPNFMADFPDQYLQSQLTQLESSGVTGAELEAKKQEMLNWMEWYKKPYNMAGMTFLEIFPIGLIISLISAFIWRKK